MCDGGGGGSVQVGVLKYYILYRNVCIVFFFFAMKERKKECVIRQSSRSSVHYQKTDCVLQTKYRVRPVASLAHTCTCPHAEHWPPNRKVYRTPKMRSFALVLGSIIGSRKKKKTYTHKLKRIRFYNAVRIGCWLVFSVRDEKSQFAHQQSRRKKLSGPEPSINCKWNWNFESDSRLCGHWKSLNPKARRRKKWWWSRKVDLFSGPKELHKNDWLGWQARFAIKHQLI